MADIPINPINPIAVLNPPASAPVSGANPPLTPPGITNSPPGTLNPPGSTPANQPPGAVFNANPLPPIIPAAVANSQVGTLINAIVVGHDVNQNVILSTLDGPITVAGEVPLQNNSQLVLQVTANNVNNAGNIFQARIVSVNGQPFTTEPTTSAQVPGQTIQPVVPTEENPAAAVQAPVPQNPATNIIGQSLQANIAAAEEENIVFNPIGSKPSGGTTPNALDQEFPAPAAATASVSLNVQTNTGGLDILHAVPPAPGGIAGLAAGRALAPSNPVDITSSASALTHGQTIDGTVIQASTDAGKFIPPSLSRDTPQTVAQLQVQAGKVSIVPTQQSTQAPVLQSSDTISLKIISAQFPGQAAAQSQSTAKDVPGGQLTGTVIGNEKTGEPIIKTPLGQIRLDSNTPLPKDTTLEIEVVALNSTANPAVANEEQSKLLSPLRATTAEAFDYLRSASPDVADKVLKNIPGLDKNFAVRLFSFINNFKDSTSPALLTAEARKFLQDAGQSGLIQKLTQDFSTAKQLVSDTRGNWNSVLFPVNDGKELQYGVMHYKKGRGDDADPESRGVKFVVELDLTHTGALQLAGEVLQKKPDKEFNLAIRSKKRLSPDMQQGITDIFVGAAEITGNNGMLQFIVDHNLSPGFSAPPPDYDMGGLLA